MKCSHRLMPGALEEFDLMYSFGPFCIQYINSNAMQQYTTLSSKTELQACINHIYGAIITHL